MLSSPLFPAVVVVVWDGRMGSREVVRGGGQPDQVTAVIMCAFATHVCPPQPSGAPERARHAGLDTEYPPR